MNGTQQVLAQAEEFYLTGDIIRTIERSAEVLLNISKNIVNNKSREK